MIFSASSLPLFNRGHFVVEERFLGEIRACLALYLLNTQENGNKRTVPPFLPIKRLFKVGAAGLTPYNIYLLILSPIPHTKNGRRVVRNALLLFDSFDNGIE